MHPTERLVGLDILRAIAIGLVLGHHMGRPPADPSVLMRVIAGWQRGGWIGVDLFFVLSGFLISGLLFREYDRHGQIKLSRFLARRGLRIYPPFYAFLAITVLLQIVLDAPIFSEVVCCYQLSLWAGCLLVSFPVPSLLWGDIRIPSIFGIYQCDVGGALFLKSLPALRFRFQCQRQYIWLVA